MELGVESNEFAYKTVSYNPATGRTAGKQALVQLRREAWDQNIPFRGYDHEGFAPGTRLQDVARHYNVSKAEYLNFTMDENLNWIAIQRAIETSSVLGHVRPNGASTESATRNGVSPHLESLSAGTRQSVTSAILQNLGRDEVAVLKRNGGQWNGAGHAVHLLHPTHKVWGIGHVSVAGTGYTAAVDGETLSQTDLSPSENRSERVALAKKNGDVQDAAGSTLKAVSVISIIGTILSILSVISAFWPMIQQFLPF